MCCGGVCLGYVWFVISGDFGVVVVLVCWAGYDEVGFDCLLDDLLWYWLSIIWVLILLRVMCNSVYFDSDVFYW